MQNKRQISFMVVAKPLWFLSINLTRIIVN